MDLPIPRKNGQHGQSSLSRLDGCRQEASVGDKDGIRTGCNQVAKPDRHPVSSLPSSGVSSPSSQTKQMKKSAKVESSAAMFIPMEGNTSTQHKKGPFCKPMD